MGRPPLTQILRLAIYVHGTTLLGWVGGALHTVLGTHAIGRTAFKNTMKGQTDTGRTSITYYTGSNTEIVESCITTRPSTVAVYN